LARSGVTPNAISAASMVTALFGAMAFIAAGRSWLPPWMGWVAAAICVQLHWVCNLLDGIVAIEGGWRSPNALAWALWVTAAGLFLTALSRLRRLARSMQQASMP